MKHTRIVKAFAVWMALMLTVISLGTKPAKADESATVRLSSATVEKGKTVTITLSVSATSTIGVVDVTFSFDSSKLQYDSGDGKGRPSGNTVRVIDYDEKKSGSYSFVFKAIDVAEEGTPITITSASVSPLDPNLGIGDNFPLSKQNGSVKITAPYQASTNAELASLSMGEANISPAFSKDVLNYSASVGGTVSKVTVSAKAADAKAKVAVTGNTGLKEGANTVSVKVTAEDGKTVKTYTITVTRGKAPTPKPATPTPTPTPPVTVKVGETNLAIKDKPDAKYVNNTEEWESTIVEYTAEGKTMKIGALTSKTTGFNVVELSDGKLYILDTEKGTATRYANFSTESQSIVFLDPSDEVIIPTGYKKTTRTFDGEEITAYAASDTSEYAIVYGKNSKGVTGWFQLDLTDGSFQRFNTEDIELVPTPTPTPSPTPTPTPEPTMTPTPEPTAAPTPTTVVQAAAPAATNKGLFSDKIMTGACVVLFVLAVTFFILYIISKKKYERRFMPDEEFLDEADDYD
ncbi:MAG: cadherin-like beta sandwich domain-containing protein [Lachnospiraceae bacterium]|nr:cadherin-like beta sandwich domain-containing protein [Lachnospiraceae bacterium]